MDLCEVKSDNYQGWSPTIPRMVTHQPKDGHPPEGSMLQTLNLALRLISQNYDQVTTARNGHLPSFGWSPTNQRMVNLQKEVWSPGSSNTIPRKVTHHPKVCHPPTQGRPPTVQWYSCTPSPGWSLNNTRMVTHHLQDGHLDLEFDSSASQLVKCWEYMSLKTCQYWHV